MLNQSSEKYLCIPFSGSTTSGDASPGRTLASQLNKLLEEYSSKGWQFLRIDTVRVHVKPSCLGALFGQSSEAVEYDIVIFQR